MKPGAVEACDNCGAEGIVAGPAICPVCRGSGNRIVVNIRPRATKPRGLYKAPAYPPARADGVYIDRRYAHGEVTFWLEAWRSGRSVSLALTVAQLTQLRDMADVFLRREE